jgi:hypothetical protein
MRQTLLAISVLALAGCGGSSHSPGSSSRSASRVDELRTYLGDYVDCLKQNDDARWRDRLRAAIATVDPQAALRAARRARMVVEEQRSCIARAGGSGLGRARATIDRELRQVSRGYAEAVTAILNVARGHAPEGSRGLRRSENRQAKAGERIGKALDPIVQEYLRLGGDERLIRRLRRAI